MLPASASLTIYLWCLETAWKSEFIYLWCRISSWHWQLSASSPGQGSLQDCCRPERLPRMPRRAVPIPGHSDGQRNKIIEQKFSLSFITPEQGWGAVQFLCCAISQQISVHEAPLCVLLGLEMLYSSSKLTFVLMLSAWCVFRVWLRFICVSFKIILGSCVLTLS